MTPEECEKDSFFTFVRADLEALHSTVQGMLGMINKRYPPEKGYFWAMGGDGKLRQYRENSEVE